MMSKVADLNDAFRMNPNRDGRFLMTHSVVSLPVEIVASALAAMMEFKDFTEDNDPYGEHDFGSFKIQEHMFFWKIDYYDKKSMDCGSEDPADPTMTTRVLTLMLAEDY